MTRSDTVVYMHICFYMLLFSGAAIQLLISNYSKNRNNLQTPSCKIPPHCMWCKWWTLAQDFQIVYKIAKVSLTCLEEQWAAKPLQMLM